MVSRQLSTKRKLEEADVITSAKRSRSDSHSSCTSAQSDYDSDGDSKSSISTPHTPHTPGTPSRSRNPRPKRYHCPYSGCTKAFNRPTRLDEHIRSHTNERPFECTTAGCDKTFLRQSHLARHIKSAHTNERDYRCSRPGCDKTFSTGTRLRRHEQGHDDETKIRCTGYAPCEKVFRKQETLQRHIETDHMQMKAFRCLQMDDDTHEPCGDGFDTAGKLRAHEVRCHGERLFLCSFCSERIVAEQANSSASLDAVPHFASYADLQAHIKAEHPPECAHCHLICSSARELKRHIDIHHSGTTLEERKTFVCEEPGCGRGFTKQGNLNTHMRTVHHADRDFVCGKTDMSTSSGLEDWNHDNGCGRMFKSKAMLETHVRVKHLVPQLLKGASVNTTSNDKSRIALQAAMAARLTGFEYPVRPGKGMTCVALDCSYICTRPNDLMIHARTAHDMDEEDVLSALEEREALSGGKFWFGDEEGTVPQDDNFDDDWYEATGLHTPAIDVRGACGYDAMAPSFSKTANGAPEKPVDLQALVDFCAVGGPVQNRRASVCIDPALTDPPSATM